MKKFDSIEDKNITFLIVDDISNMRRTIKNMLKHLGYKNFYEAENGKVALSKLELYPIDIIILDWNMPVMNGSEFLREIKENKELKYIPVILITGESDVEIVADIAELGADEFIIKPFYPKTLEQKIKSVIDSCLNDKRAAYHIIKGFKFLDEKKYSEALESFKKAIKIDNKATRAYGGMAKVFIETDHLDKAELVLKEALKINPRYIEGYNLLGEIYEKIVDKEKAVDFFEKANDLNPKNIERNLKLGDLNFQLNKPEKAEEHLTKALKESGNKKEIKIKVADTYFKNNHDEKAIELLNELTQESPNYIVAYNRIGIILRKQGKYDEAIENYKKALLFAGENEVLYHNIGRAYLEKRDLENAYKYFQKALEVNPEFEEARKMFLKVKKKLGK